MTLNLAPTRRGAVSTNPKHFEIDTVATDLVIRYGSVILDDAIRFSACRADAEDAYSRALEILLTKAPSADPEHLVPWLRTVVRREAADIARSTYNRTSVPLLDEADQRPAVDGNPEARIEAIVDLEIGSEALAKLSHDQVRCMLAQAEGLTYEEIAERTGFTRRKVSRCVNEGRKAFARRLGEIAAGTECERVQPLLFKLLDGDSEAAIQARPHLRHCTACRARLRLYEQAPRNVAALFPAALVLAGSGGRGVISWLTGTWSELTAKLAVHSHAGERWAELGAVKKTGVVVAVGATLAGGGAAVQEVTQSARTDHVGATATETSSGQRGRVISLLDPIETSPRPTRRRSRTKPTQQKPEAQPAPVTPKPPNQAPPPSAVQNKPEPVDDGSSEFLPEAR